MYTPKPLEVAFTCPTGKIVYANDLRWAYKIPEEEGSPQSCNGALWNKIITLGYGGVGLLHGYVGNSCPSINRIGEKLIIGNSSYDSDTYDSRDDLPGKRVGGICTDLWWYSLADKMDFEIHARAAGVKPKDISKEYDGVIDVEPGRYILKHYYPYCEFYGENTDLLPEIFATIEPNLRPVNNPRLPDEGIAEMIMRLPDVEYACVDYDHKKFDEINKDENLVFRHYQILIHWEDPKLGTFFTTPKFTNTELLNRSLIISRIYEGRAKKEKEEIKHRKLMEELKVNTEAMAPEEREAYNNRVEKTLQKILKRL